MGSATLLPTDARGPGGVGRDTVVVYGLGGYMLVPGGAGRLATLIPELRPGLAGPRT
jgi:hypothetical protein